jgi:hypothetical protein
MRRSPRPAQEPRLPPPYLYDRLIKDDEYIGRVRKHKPSSLVPLIAEVGARYWEHDSWLESPYKAFTPWALADIARVSLVTGNEYRKDATENDLLQCAGAYASLADPQLPRAQQDALEGFLLRKASEQLVYGQSRRHELGRTAALFEQTPPVKPPKVMQSDWAEQLFGCSLSQYVGIGFLVHTASVKNHGRFSVEWLDASVNEPITKQLPVDLVRAVLDQHFIGDRQWFKNEDGLVAPSQDRRFTYNPLLGRPVVSGIAGELLVPVPGQVIRKISPLGIWYSGFDRWGKFFADDVGDLFEQYIGRQLQTIPGAQVHREIPYGRARDNKRSVDWIVVCDKAVLLVEVKSARPTKPVRLGSPEAWSELTTKLSHAYKQIAATEQAIADGETAFSAIPKNLPRLGLIVTMEPFHVVNARPIRDRYAASLSIPTIVCSSESLEWVVSLKDRDVDTYLREFLNDPAKDGWDLADDLVGIEFGSNAVLDQASESYRWGRPPDAGGPNPSGADSAAS